MNKFQMFAGTLVALTGGAAMLAAFAPAPAPLAAQGTYQVDPVHSTLVFRIRHNNVGGFYGRFNQISGTFDLNSADAAKSSLDVSVKTDSVDTSNAKRDQHLKSQDFFSAAEFPAITFKGKEFKKSGSAWEVKGDLTLHGVTKSVTATVEDSSAENYAGAEAKFTIKRSDFGMKFMLDKLGDEVTVMVGLEGKK